jgi:excisionase family DNA binding protein
MDKLILSNIPLPELESLIKRAIQEALDTKHEPQSKPEIIDRKELCTRLNISDRTASTWEKKGKIPFLMVGSSIRYNWPKVIEALEKKGGRR